MSNLCNAGARMSLGKWWLWALLGLLALYLLMLFSKWHSIEDDIQTRTQAALSENGYSWASVDQTNRGRDVLLSGQAPDQAAVSDALALVQKVKGVRVVDTDTSIVEWVSSQIGLSAKQGKMTLTGTLPDQASIDQLVQEVTNVAGAGQVDNQLQLSTTAKEPKWLGKVLETLPILKTMQNAELHAEDGVFSAQGDVNSDGAKNDIHSWIQAHFGDDYKGQFNVVGPSAEALAAIAAEARQREDELAAKMVAEQMRLDEEAAQMAAAKAQREAGDTERNKLLSARMNTNRSMFLDTCQTRFDQLMQGRKIEFATASDAIVSQSFPLLVNIIRLVAECNPAGDLHIEISGHTDDIGGEAENLALSAARAASVMRYLVEAGVGEGVLSAKGYGEGMPLADNTTVVGRAQNRRIQFIIKR